MHFLANQFFDDVACCNHLLRCTMGCMQTDQRAYADAGAQLPAEETKPYEQLIRNFLLQELQGGGAVYAVPWQLKDMHKKACKTISAATMIVHLQSRGNSIISVPTQINVYFVWLTCMQAMHSATLQPTHPKAMYAEYFKSMTPEKVVVLLPAVCLWLCVKCMEVWQLGCKDVLRIVDGVQQARNFQVHFTLEDVRHAEHAVLQMIGFDILKNQDNIDRIEDILRDHLQNFEDMYVSSDAKVIRSLFCIFYDIGGD